MMQSKNIVILGGHGFIGHHIARLLDRRGNYVRTVDIKEYEYGSYDFSDEQDPRCDLTIWENVAKAIMFYGKPADEVYNLAAWMGGAGVIFSGAWDERILHDNARININVASACAELGVGKVFFSSSACCYPHHIQGDPNNPGLKESDAYPANPDSPYGLEKLFAEQVYAKYAQNAKLNVRIGRFHNIFGPEGAWNNGREKAPAAICRKVAEAEDDGEIEIWGDGQQSRSFMFIEECVHAVIELMAKDYNQPINIGSSEMVTINQLAQKVIDISGKNLTIKNIPSDTLGVRGRNSDNTLFKQVIGWAPFLPLEKGLRQTYQWISQQVKREKLEHIKQEIKERQSKSTI